MSRKLTDQTRNPKATRAETPQLPHDRNFSLSVDMHFVIVFPQGFLQIMAVSGAAFQQVAKS